MQEINQKVIMFQHNESFRGYQYEAGKSYLIQDIPRGFIEKWIRYGHQVIDDHKDLEVNDDARPKELIKAEYDAMIQNEEKKRKGFELERGAKKEVKQVVEEKVVEPPQVEVESIVEEKIEGEEKVEEQPEEKPKKTSRRRKKKTE